MKRLVALTAAAVLALSLAACGTAPSTADTPAETPAPTAAPTTEPDISLKEAADAISTAEQIEVEDNLFDVTLTLPADYASDITAEEIAQQVADGKVHTGVLNDDGSVTYTMSKAQHAALLESIAAELRSTLDDMIGSTDYPNLTRIETNDDFTDFTVYTTTQPGAVGLSDEMSVLIYYTCGKMYGIVSGQEPGNIHVDILNAESGELVSSHDSKDFNQ
jgi:hypothetical protein